MATIDELRALAREIREERQIGGNTGARVGNTFDKVADLLESTGGDISDIREAVEQLLQDVGFIPRDISRTATDAVFTNSEGELLFWLRAATDTLAGLITAANNNKLIALPTAEELAQALAAKQNRLTFDPRPIEGSTNPVTSDGINTAIANFITRSVSDLIYYYTKSETYTKEEVNALVAAIKQFVPVVAQTLPTPSADTMYKLYLIPSEDPQEGNIKDEYITIDNGASANPRYTWEKIGSVDIDISGKADIGTVPADVTRTQTDATFVNNNHDPLFYLRQATSSLAGLMTAAEHTKLGALPTAQDLNTRIEGTIYDVSVLHPTSGVGGGNTYASLSAALAVIPQDKKKGGMTVRYVYSYDNNYVQFRYMGTAVTGNPNPFLDTANWQGVDEEPTDGSKNIVKSGGIYTWVMGRIATAISTIKEWAGGLFAKTDGYYESMTVGRADNLTGEPIPVTTGYTTKHTGYDPSQSELEFADGLVKMTEARGRAVAWNQLCKNDASNVISEVTIVDGCFNFNKTTTAAWNSGMITIPFPNKTTHKFFARLIHVGGTLTKNGDVEPYIYNGDGASATKLLMSGSSRILTFTTGSDTFGIFGNIGDVYDNYKFKLVYIDLTLECPTLAAKADLTVADVEAYLASIRTPKPYINYNAGTLLGARLMGWQLRKTANLLNPTTGQAILVPYNYTGHNNEYTVNGWDELTGAALQFTPYNTGVVESVTLDADNRFVIPSMGVLEVVEAEAGTAITGDMTKVAVVMTYDTTMDGEVVAYEQDNIEIDSANIYYDNNGIKTQVFENGIMRSTGDDSSDVHDRVYFDEVAKKWKAVQNVFDVNLNQLQWTRVRVGGDHYVFQSEVLSPALKTVDNGTLALLICARYQKHFPSTIRYGGVDKAISQWFNYSNKIGIIDDAYTDATVFKNSLNGVHCFYALATPITHDTLYYKVGNEYVPMEQVFSDGINGLCCNWATETLVEQAEVDGQPQSIIPVTTEVFQSDYKELLKTIGDTYISKEQTKDSFENFLTVLNTNSGTALGGTYATDGFNSNGTIKFNFTANA